MQNSVSEPQKKLPLWRRIPGFRSGKPWKMAVASVIYLCGLVIIFGVLAGTESKPPTAGPVAAGGLKVSVTPQASGAPVTGPPQPQPESAEEFKASCRTVSFDALARDTEKYLGQRVVFTGKAVQVLEVGSKTIMRVNVTKGEYGIWEDTVWVNYTRKPDESRILEDDINKFWGTVRGRRTYTAVLGQEITLPEIDAKYLLVTQKRSEQ